MQNSSQTSFHTGRRVVASLAAQAAGEEGGLLVRESAVDERERLRRLSRRETNGAWRIGVSRIKRDKQRHGEWEGRVMLWFNPASMSYRGEERPQFDRGYNLSPYAADVGAFG